MDESVPQARQGQGQGLFLYRLQTNAAEFIKKKVLTPGVKTALTPAVYFTADTARKNSPGGNMVISASMALVFSKNIGWFQANRHRFILIAWHNLGKKSDTRSRGDR